jgi:hypothetical protein
MKTTKTLILTALLGIAGSATVMAQSNVYSLNIVGYVNASVIPGFNLLANPVVTGTNGIGQVLPSVSEGTLVYKYLPNGSFNIDIFASGAWYDFNTELPSTTTLSPGEGFFVYASGSSTITFVGEVKTGTNTVTLNTGFNLVSSVVPQRYELLSPDFPAANGMVHYSLNTNGTFTVSLYDTSVGWFDQDTEAPRQVYSSPDNAPATGFYLYNPAGTTPWTRTFNVN